MKRNTHVVVVRMGDVRRPNPTGHSENDTSSGGAMRQETTQGLGRKERKKKSNDFHWILTQVHTLANRRKIGSIQDRTGDLLCTDCETEIITTRPLNRWKVDKNIILESQLILLEALPFSSCFFDSKPFL